MSREDRDETDGDRQGGWDIYIMRRGPGRELLWYDTYIGIHRGDTLGNGVSVIVPSYMWVAMVERLYVCHYLKKRVPVLVSEQICTRTSIWFGMLLVFLH